MKSALLTPALCKAGRALAGFNQRQLAKRAGVGSQTLADFEREARTPFPETLERLVLALETAGVQFIAENGGGAGVRLAKRGRKR